VDGQVAAQVGGAGWYQALIYSQHDAGYYSYYAAMEAIGVTGLEPARGQQQIARSAGWWWAYRDFAVLTERPAILRRDAAGDLHSADGMAVAYPDGWGFWCWHGRRVPAWVVEKPTVEAVAAEENAEVRRCAIESMGWARFTREAGLELVGAADDPGNFIRDRDDRGRFTRVPAKLELYDVPERLWGSRIRLLQCTNGSAERDGKRRQYGITVPAHINDPLEAAAWTVGETAAEYAQTIRRT